MICTEKIVAGLTNGSSFGGVFLRDYTIADAEFDFIECVGVQFDERNGEPGEHDAYEAARSIVFSRRVPGRSTATISIAKRIPNV